MSYHCISSYVMVYYVATPTRTASAAGSAAPCPPGKYINISTILFIILGERKWGDEKRGDRKIHFQFITMTMHNIR